MMKNLERAEHWYVSRMLRIPWTDKVSTCEMFRRARIGKGLLQFMVRRQITFLEHLFRNNEPKDSTNWICEGTPNREKQRKTFLTYLSKHKGIKLNEIIRQATDSDM